MYRCKHRSIQRVRHQRVHDRKHRCATSDKHCQQLIVNACRNHRERGIEVDLRASLGGVYTLATKSTVADTVDFVAGFGRYGQPCRHCVYTGPERHSRLQSLPCSVEFDFVASVYGALHAQQLSHFVSVRSLYLT